MQKAVRGRTRRLAIALAIVLVLDLVLCVGAFWYLFLRPSLGVGHPAITLIVPDVTGLDESEARERLRSAGGDGADFSVSVEYTYHDSPCGTVISQVPAANSRRRAVVSLRPCPVTLRVSLGKQTVALPSLVGQTLREAEQALTSLGLKFQLRLTNDVGQNATHVEAADPAATVLWTEPEAGSLLVAGDTVTLLLRATRGNRSVVIPDLLGLTRSQAEVQLYAAGLTIGEVTELRPDGGFPVGEAIVTRQQYLAGTRMVRGTAVGFTLENRILQ